MAEKITPPIFGRLVWINGADLTKGQSRDSKGKPYVFSSGPNMGEPYAKYDFGVAVPKEGPDWKQTVWGKQIVAAAIAAWPGGQTAQRKFAWKVTDGDSTDVNANNRKPCDMEGYPGHWVLAFSATQPAKVFEASSDGSRWVEHPSPHLIKRGWWIQVGCSVSGNKSSDTPGVFLNHNMVAFIYHDHEIKSSFADANAAGFGNVPLPPGASVTPLAPSAPLPGTASAAPPLPPTTPVTATSLPPTPPVSAAPPVTPNTSYMAATAPAAPPPPAPPPAPPSGPGNMLPAATATYEQYRASGWTDTQLVQHGLMADYIPF